MKGPERPARRPVSGSREGLAGCLAAPVFIVSGVVGGIVFLAAVFIGSVVIAKWISAALGPALVTGLMGLFIIGIGFGSLIHLVVHPDRWHFSSRIGMLLVGVVLGFLGLLGVAMLVSALTQPTARPGF